MASAKPSRFAERVLSSTRISENSYLINADDDEPVDHKRKLIPPYQAVRRRRLRVLDDDDQDDREASVNDENTDPSFLSNALPSSIRAPASSSRLSSDNEAHSDDEEELRERNNDFMTPSSNDEDKNDSESDEEPIASLSRRLRTGYDPRISISERDRLGERSPSVASIVSEPEEEVRHEEERLTVDDQNDDVDVQALDRLRKLAKGASKNTVKKPRPKLDPECLLSNRGLPALLTECKRAKFKGKGYEFQDLDRLLFLYEVWANRLLPKSTFIEIIERLERVGSRREIQVAMQRLRNGIWPPYLSAEHIQNSASDNEDGSLEHHDNLEGSGIGDTEEAAWERALQAMPDQKIKITQPLGQRQFSQPDAADESHSDLDSVRQPVTPTSDQPEFTQTPGPSTSTMWTAETRAEQNRLLALARLEARRQASQSGSQLSQTSGVKSTPGSKSILKSSLKAALATKTPVDLSNSSCAIPMITEVDRNPTATPDNVNSSTQGSGPDIMQSD